MILMYHVVTIQKSSPIQKIDYKSTFAELQYAWELDTIIKIV